MAEEDVQLVKLESSREPSDLARFSCNPVRSIHSIVLSEDADARPASEGSPMHSKFTPNEGLKLKHVVPGCDIVGQMLNIAL